MEISELVYVAFKDKVVALDRATGAVQWDWEIPQGRNYPAILVDGDRVFVSAMGYTYCLDAATGAFLWENILEGYGTGVACIATVNGNTQSPASAAEEEEENRRRSHHTSNPIMH